MPCNITRQVPALQLTIDWGRLGHKVHPSHPLQRAVCFHTWWCHTGSVPSGLGVAPQEGTPQCNAWPEMAHVPPLMPASRADPATDCQGCLEQCGTIAGC